MQQQIQAAGLPWFERDDYEAFRSVLPDRNWHDTYDEWERVAEATFSRLKKEGVQVVKAKVRSGEFVDWCKTTGRVPDTQALLNFGNEAAYRHLVGNH